MKIDLVLAAKTSPLRKNRSAIFRMDVHRIQYAFLFFVALSGSYFMGLITTLRSAPPVPIYTASPQKLERPPEVPQVGEVKLVRRANDAPLENDRLGAPSNGVEFEWGKGPPTSEEMRESFGGGDSDSNEGGKERKRNDEEEEPEEEGGNVDYDIRGDAHEKDKSEEEDASSHDEEEKSEKKKEDKKKAKKEDEPFSSNTNDDDLRSLISSKMPSGLDLVDFNYFEKDIKRCFNGTQYIDGCNRDNAIKRQRTCAVVGNSGILSKSGCGKAIDDHDFVIRINFPNLKDYEKDVGEKTNLMVVGRHVLSVIYKCIKDKQECFVLKRVDDLDKAYLYHPEALVELESQTARRPYKKITYVKKYVSAHKNVVNFLYSMSSAPERIRELGRSLVERFPENPSNGAIAYSLALTFCDEVDLYGFFPFKQYQDKAVSQHYHTDPELGGDGFDEKALEQEWSYMRELESKGALKFYIDACKSKNSK
ncbi:PREDICTED: beta-galactoside alpha-2,6-sialyltransferase 2-like [Branchiostoma belcheri]|uniref:Beta-galactoside alpha-2,6-sialyltransferase 2-like n=1 Tax=Branchiostoma belcheri TaxID=7741 RepID=A0A6P4YUA5_BRABE|nr:PREDICTED: beta-galactoside alpha-2,6-sialyltransferase 2-like [Branchiostoma belcheri]